MLEVPPHAPAHARALKPPTVALVNSCARINLTELRSRRWMALTLDRWRYRWRGQAKSDLLCAECLSATLLHPSTHAPPPLPLPSVHSSVCVCLLLPDRGLHE